MTAPRFRPSKPRRDRKRQAFAADVIACVSRVFEVPVPVLHGKARPARIVAARFAAFHLCHDLTALAFSQVGALFGGRDHSTVIHGIDRCLDSMQRDRAYAAQVRIVRRLALKSAPWTVRGWGECPAGPGVAIAPREIEVIWQARPAPEPEPEAAPWWELTDDEWIAQRIAAHRAKGGDFVEVFS